MCLGIALGKQKIHFENTKFKFVLGLLFYLQNAYVFRNPIRKVKNTF